MDNSNCYSCTLVVYTECGKSASENITYWTSPTAVSSGNCMMTVCPVNTDICQVKF